MLMLAVAGACQFALAQDKPSPEQEKLPIGNYIVVGAFARIQNAQVLAKQVNTKKGLPTHIAFIDRYRLFYVYTEVMDNRKLAWQKAVAMREQPEFWDAWVYSIESETATPSGLAPEEPPASLYTPETEPVKVNQPDSTTSIQADSLLIHSDSTTTLSRDTTSITSNPEVFLSLYNSTNDLVVDGEVSIIDGERPVLITKAPGNQYYSLPKPPNTSGKLILICDILGYRKIQHEVVYNHVLTDSTSGFVEDMGVGLMINFALIKYQKGDIRTLFQVYFYNDSDIMRPESKYELNLLLDMMNRNPGYRIRLHGHTNGKFTGKIIKAQPHDFFTLSRQNETTTGTAVKLSLLRAEAIRQFLIDKGVDASRIEVKGWGGKRPLYDRNSANAKKNVRAEVEILTNG